MGYRKRLYLYLLYAILPMLVVFLITYNILANGIINQIESRESVALKAYANKVNALLQGVDNVSVQLSFNYTSSNSNFDNIVNMPFEQIKQVLQNNSAVMLASPFINSIYVYFVENNRFIYNDQFSYWDSFNDKEWLTNYKNSAEGKAEAAQWISSRKFTGSGNISEVATYIRPFPIASNPKQGYIAINLDNQKLFQNVFELSQGEYIVASPEGKILYSKGKRVDKLPDKNDKTIKIDGVKYVISNYMAANNLRYISLNEEKQLLAPLKPIKFMLLCILSVSVLFILILSIKTTNDLYKPLKELMEFVNRSKNSDGDEISAGMQNEFEYIKDKFIREMNKKEKAEEQLKINSNAVIEKIARYLLRGERISQEELSSVKLFDKIPACYQVVTFILDENNADEQQILHELCGEFFEYSFIPVSIDNYICSLIIYLGADEKYSREMLQESLNTITKELSQKNIYSVAGVGSLQADITGIYKSHLQSIRAARYRIYTGSEVVIFIDEVKEDGGKNSYFYSIDFENKLVSAIKEKKCETAEKCIRDIINNIRELKLPPEYAGSRLASLKDILFNIPSSLGYSLEEIFQGDYIKIYEGYKQNKSLEEIGNYYTELCRSIIKGLQQKSKNKNQLLIEDVKKYVISNIGNDISLSTVADDFELSAPYLSTIFKQETGENFAKYILDLRMELAVNLIKETDMNMKDISEKIGYLNERSFYNAFKKHTGETPAEYRKQFRRESL